MALSQRHAPSSYAAEAISRGLNHHYVAATDDIDRAIAAAYRLIEKHESVDVKMRELLAEAGLSTQQFYRYFPSKDDFFVVLLEDGQQKLLTYLEHRIAKHKTPKARLQACLEGFLAQAEDPNAAARTRPFLVHKARLHRERERLGQTINSGFLDLFAAEIEASRPARPEAASSARADAGWLLALILAVMENYILEGAAPTAAQKESLLAFCFRALGL
ncbi:MAG TPA: TetR/AcrR family transcriptional regulator [Mycobacteriales bacterium]|jgi:AcrR family transcriptional regulator|nr:TetR/AcrR family transcriptional regulator [Mycobacteriales bacterium]